LFALVLSLGGDYVSGLVLLTVVVLGLLARVKIREQNVAGSYTKARWRLAFAQTIAFFLIYLAVTAILVIAAVQHWGTLDARGRVAVYALAGFAWLLYREMDRRGEDAIRWLKGTHAEEDVGDQLDQLRTKGWEVVHNLKKDFGGNVDHIVWGDGGVYAIETKNGRFRHRDVPQAVGNAVWVKQKFGARWVSAVLCVTVEPPSPPRQVGYAWVIGPDDLAPWLLGRPKDGSRANLEGALASLEAAPVRERSRRWLSR
jgi:hypothetical protein